MSTNGKLKKQFEFQDHRKFGVNPDFETSQLCDVDCYLNFFSFSFLDNKREINKS